MSTKAKNEAFKKGDRVKARWSGSNIFYDAKVVSVTSRSYKVQFDDGSISSVKTSDVQKMEKADTPPKTSKSRSRSRSTGRMTRSRSRSPARRTKAAATKKEKKASSEISTKSEGTSNSNSVTKDEVDSVPTRTYLTREKVSSSKIETKETTTSSVGARNSLTKDLKVILRRSEGSSENKRSARLSALRSESSQRFLESKIAERRNAKEAEKAKYSDDDEEEEEEEEEEDIPVKASSIRRVLNFIAVFLKMIIVPVALLFLVFSCTKRQCTIMDFPPFYTRIRDLLNAVKFPMAGIFAFHVVQLILSLIPLGKKATGFISEPNKIVLEYRLNGLFPGILSLFLTIMVFGVSAYFGVYLNWAYDKFRGIALGAAIYSTLCGVILFLYTGVKEGFANQKASYIDQFYSGCYSNPIFFNKLDLKTSLIRTGFIGAVVLNLSILLKYFLMKGYVSIPLAMTTGMQLFFILDLILREEKLLSTATYTSDTVGYSFFMTTCFMIPIGLSFQNIYLFILDSKSYHTPYWCSGAMLCLFLVGYYIYLTSSNLKHNFRKNPFAPELADVTSIPTSKKKRLVSSGWWGRIRHPNYFGLFIMATAWTLPCGFTHAVPYGPLLILAIALIVRIFRVEAECKEKYGPAWTNYTEKVRSRILPYIF